MEWGKLKNIGESFILTNYTSSFYDGINTITPVPFQLEAAYEREKELLNEVLELQWR